MLKKNTLSWAIMWVEAGAPSDPEWWTHCHHRIVAQLANFRKRYSAATNYGARLAIMEEYGLIAPSPGFVAPSNWLLP